MLRIYPSTSTTQLFAKLEEDIRALYRSPEHSFFDDINIIVQSPAIEKWLQVQLAQEHNIVANISFPMPATFIWKIYQQLLGSELIAEHNSYAKPAMSWRLMRIIDEHFSSLPAAVQKLLAEHKDQQIMQYTFCENMADVFDQYLVFRPEWIKHWQQPKTHTKHSLPKFIAEHWQGKLWQLLVEHDEPAARGQHRAHFNQLAIEHLHSHGLDIKTEDTLNIKVLFIFAINTLPPQHLALIQALAQHIDVHFYLLSPSLHYYGDIQSRKKQAWIQSHQASSANSAELHLSEGNPLLAAMGASAKHFTDQLLEADADAYFEYDLEDPHNDTASEPSHLLAYSQYEIRELCFSGAMDYSISSNIKPNFLLSPSDDSILIHSCHSRFRELQVLRNQLLNFFTNDTSLRPQDVIILAPNPDDYAPYIRAVFGHDHQQPGFLDIAINASSVLDKSPLVSSFFKLLDIAKQRFKASHIAELIHQPAIYNKWNFNEQERDQIQHWISSLGVHWAWNGATKTQWQLPANHKHTWENAIQGSLLGLLIDEDAGVFTNIKNPNQAYNPQSQEQAALWGRWFNFLQQLHVTMQQLELPRTINHWHSFLNQLLDHFYAPTTTIEEQAIQAIRQQLFELQHAANISTYSNPVDIGIVLSLMRKALSQPQQNFQLISGKINFASLLPMRGIEFRVVCLLGMNDGEYPHPDTQVEFNLMAQQARQLGDRSRREEDAYQFLQALLCAQDKLHISFQGRSPLDNSKQNPSSFVQELLYYCTHSAMLADTAQPSATNLEAVAQQLLIEHPLYAFNTSYFTSPQRLKNFSQIDYSCAQQVPKKKFNWYQTDLDKKTPRASKSRKNVVAHDVALDSLLYFYKNTSKYFCQLNGVYLETSHQLIDDEEPLQFAPGLPRYIYFNDALQAIHNGLDFQTWQQHISYHSDTPNTMAGVIGSIKIWNDAQTTWQLACSQIELDATAVVPLSEHKRQLHTYFKHDTFSFNASVETIHEHNLLHFKYTNPKAHDLLTLWLHHLAANVEGNEVESWLFFPQANMKKPIHFKALSSVEAQRQLTLLIEAYLNSQCNHAAEVCKFISFDAALSHTYCESLIQDADPQLAINKCLDALENSHNAYVNLVFNSELLASEDFQSISNRIFTPLLENLQTTAEGNSSRGRN